MGDLTTAKIAHAYFDRYLETWEEQIDMIPLVESHEPPGDVMQNSGDSYWEPVQQHSNIIEGEDISGDTPSGIIEESVRCSLGTFKNVWTKQKARDLRDKRFWERKGVVDAVTQNQRLNTDIANAVAIQGSMFYRSNDTSGLDFTSKAQVLMNERQLATTKRYYMYNDTDSAVYANELGSRQTLQGRPEKAWSEGQLAQNICQFDVFTGSFLPNLAGGASPDTTVTGNQTFAPTGGSVTDATNTVTNTDYRYADIPVAASGSYNVGDKIKFINTATDVYAVGKGDKTNTLKAMTFSIIAKPDATTITIFPKPIAADDAALSVHEKAYANIDTTILNGAIVTRLNIGALEKTNIFWDKYAVKVIGGNLPAQMFEEFRSAKVLTKTLSNGLPMYLMYDGDIAELTFRYRLVSWTGVTVVAPQSCGVGIRY